MINSISIPFGCFWFVCFLFFPPLDFTHDLLFIMNYSLQLYVKCPGGEIRFKLYGQHMCKVIQNKQCLPELCNVAYCVKKKNGTIIPRLFGLIRNNWL